MSKQNGTHTLKLEFIRNGEYDLNTSLASSYEHTQIEAEFDDEVLINEITENFSPEEIFGVDCLNDWAIDKTEAEKLKEALQEIIESGLCNLPNVRCDYDMFKIAEKALRGEE